MLLASPFAAGDFLAPARVRNFVQRRTESQLQLLKRVFHRRLQARRSAQASCRDSMSFNTQVRHMVNFSLLSGEARKRRCLSDMAGFGGYRSRPFERLNGAHARWAGAILQIFMT
jgi:hypothetical protein